MPVHLFLRGLFANFLAAATAGLWPNDGAAASLYSVVAASRVLRLGPAPALSHLHVFALRLNLWAGEIPKDEGSRE